MLQRRRNTAGEPILEGSAEAPKASPVLASIWSKSDSAGRDTACGTGTTSIPFIHTKASKRKNGEVRQTLWEAIPLLTWFWGLGVKGAPGPFFSSSHQAAPRAPLRPGSGTLPMRQSPPAPSAARRPGLAPACGSELLSVAAFSQALEVPAGAHQFQAWISLFAVEDERMLLGY